LLLVSHDDKSRLANNDDSHIPLQFLHFFFFVFFFVPFFFIPSIAFNGWSTLLQQQQPPPKQTQQ
jgi:hypothetical protein